MKAMTKKILQIEQLCVTSFIFRNISFRKKVEEHIRTPGYSGQSG